MKKICSGGLSGSFRTVAHLYYLGYDYSDPTMYSTVQKKVAVGKAKGKVAKQLGKGLRQSG